MTKEVSLTAGFCPPAFSFENLCVCSELLACIQAIWNRLLSCMIALARWLHPESGPIRALQDPRFYPRVTSFLSLKDLATCEVLSQGLKVPDSIWKERCELEQVSYYLPDGHNKEAFTNPQPPAAAFGPEQWKEHLKVELDPVDLDPKTRARLPARVHRQAAQFKDTRRLLLVPGTLQGKPFCYETFAPVADRAGMKLDITAVALAHFGKVAAGASRWVWVEVALKEGSREITHKDAERIYPGELGRSLWYALFIVADYARDKICRFPRLPVANYVWTADRIEHSGGWFLVVGSSKPGHFYVLVDNDRPGSSIGVASAMPALSS